MSQRLTLNSRLRHLRPSHVSTLSLMLDPFDEWKDLASRIVTRTGHPMFNLDKINYINHRTKMSGQSATEEILKSWFTDNPSIYDLRTILYDMNMRRAVEYIDNEILSVSGDVSSAPVKGDKPSTPTSPNCVDVTRVVDDCRKFSYDFLRTVTDNFSCIPLSDGGRLIGKGGFGEVFKGVHDNYPDMAVKRFFVTSDDDDDQKITYKQFVTELEVLSKCQHENILPLIGYCEERLCVVYEYMINGSLEDRLACKNNTASLPVACRLKIVKGVARGLNYLHNLSPPLIHRDIKSANILLDSNFTAKIGDCGTVREGPRGSKTSTLTQFPMGTFPYMPHEYYEVSTKTDAYSFGVVLLEVLTGLPVMDDNREDRSLPTHIRETIQDDDITSLLDTTAGDWGDTLPHDMYRLSKQFMESKHRRLQVGEALPQIESWKEP